MFLVEVYQVMQSQEYGDTLFTEAVAGFTATGFNTCLRHCLLNHHQVFSTSCKGGQVFLPEESVRVSCIRVSE